MASGPHRHLGAERRRHFRVEGEWPIRVEALELTGQMSEFEGIARNISMSGVLLEAAVEANLWTDKPLTTILPGGVGPVESVVRRFLEYGDDDHRRTRWGIEFGDMTVMQRGLWARFVFSEAHRLGQEEAHRAFLRSQVR